MENKTKNRKSREVIEAMAKRSFSGVGLADTEDAITELKEGWFNVAYNIKLADGRESILKIAPPIDSEVLSYEKNIMNTEVNMMRLAGKETDVKIPEVYYYDDNKDICDSDYFFMEKLTGSNYGNVKEGFSEEMNSRINYQIGESLRKINSIEGRPYFGYDGNPELRGSTWRETFLKMINAVLENGNRKQVEVGFSYDEIYSLIESHAHYLDAVTTPHFVHWDCWDPNVFVKDGNVVGIIDFERVLWGDYLMESTFRTDNADQLAGYGKIEFSYEEIVRCKLYDAYLYLIMIIECYYRSYDKDFKNNIEQYALKSLANAVKWLREND
jgi:aminoglycoside phosphotransferase (APT) family kinase protein